MTQPVVTQAHREHAVLAIYDAYTTPGTSLNDWCLTGKPGHMTGTYRRLDAVAQAIADAEQKGRELERADVSWYLRSTPRAGGVLISIEHSNTVARLAGDIERGEHRKR